MEEFYKRDGQFFKVDDAGVVKEPVNESEIPEEAKIIEKPIQEEKNKIPTEEGAFFEKEGKLFIVKNGAAVRPTKEEQRYYEQLNKD